jgi:hypothetical protein
MQMLCLTLDPGVLPNTANAPVRLRLARAVGLPDFAILERYLRETRQKIRYIFNAFLGPD